jgi:hypothetical protein
MAPCPLLFFLLEKSGLPFGFSLSLSHCLVWTAIATNLLSAQLQRLVLVKCNLSTWGHKMRQQPGSLHPLQHQYA